MCKSNFKNCVQNSKEKKIGEIILIIFKEDPYLWVPSQWSIKDSQKQKDVTTQERNFKTNLDCIVWIKRPEMSKFQHLLFEDLKYLVHTF